MTTLVKLAETKLDLQVSIANKTIEKNSERNQSSSALDLSLFVQDVQHLHKSKPTWGNKLRKKGQKWRKDEFRSVFKNLLQKTSKNSHITTEISTAI